MGQRDALRHEFAEKQQKYGQPEGHEDGGQRPGFRGEPGDASQVLADLPGEAQAANRAGDQRRQGQPELDQGQKARRLRGPAAARIAPAWPLAASCRSLVFRADTTAVSAMLKNPLASTSRTKISSSVGKLSMAAPGLRGGGTPEAI